MPSGDSLPPLIVIIGPTAVGKTEIAIRLAERLSGEIVSADSRLFYRGMDIGTAKPSLVDRQRVPHHLIDVADPDEVWSLARFQREARWVIGEILTRNRLPFLVGGTGQYVRAVTQGWQPPTVKPSPRLRNALESWAREIGEKGLHDRLYVLDADAAEKIDFRNLRRTIRALEVILSTGERFSEQRGQSPPIYDLLQLGLSRPRPELYARVDQRIHSMFEAGFIEEVRSLLEMGYAPNLPTFSGIGYREVSAYLQGKITLDEAIAQMKKATRIFVRRQANWFKPDDPDIHWFDVDEHTVEKMEQTIQTWLADRIPDFPT